MEAYVDDAVSKGSGDNNNAGRVSDTAFFPVLFPVTKKMDIFRRAVWTSGAYCRIRRSGGGDGLYCHE